MLKNCFKLFISLILTRERQQMVQVKVIPISQNPGEWVGVLSMFCFADVQHKQQNTDVHKSIWANLLAVKQWGGGFNFISLTF